MNAVQEWAGYTILREIGHGNMGTVYLATKDGREVALKIVRGGPDAEDQDRINAEERGAKIQSEIAAKDARVVRVRNIVRINGDLGIEMEYVEGEDLSAIIARGSIPNDKSAQITLKLCQLFDNLDRQGSRIAHGDLKPRNIRVTPSDDIKVLDFGIAKELKQAGTVNVFQSTSYCSPERLETDQVDSQSDLWSIGVILYEMVSGRRPFSGIDTDLKRRIVSGSGPDPLPPGCPEHLRRIIYKMLAHERRSRYQSATEACADLLRYLEGQPVLAPPVDDDEVTRRTAPRSTETTQRSTEATRRTVAPAKRTESKAPLLGWFRQRQRLVRLGLMCLFTLVTVGFVSHEFNVGSQATELRKLVESNQTTVEKAWPEYEEIEKKSTIKIFVLGLRRSLKSKLIESATQPIADYRRDQPTAREGDWSRALSNLKRALTLGPNDKEAQAKLHLCEGHLARIRAKGNTKQRSFNEAMSHFEDAAKLMPDAPDPYLGLARLYYYDLNEVEKGMDMVREAAKRGHPTGKREKAQMADALRARGVRMEQNSKRLQNLPEQEKQSLEKARDDLKSAAQAYAELTDYTREVPFLLRDTLQRIERIEQRIHELNPGFF